MKIQLYKNGEPFNTIVATETFVEAYCAEHNLTYTIIVEPEPEPVRVGQVNGSPADRGQGRECRVH